VLALSEIVDKTVNAQVEKIGTRDFARKISTREFI
jgi:hypothetical protein